MDKQQEQEQLHHLHYLLGAAQISRAICAAAQLRLADQLKDGVMSITELAEATDTHAPSLCHLLRALASIGLFAEVEPDMFANTQMSSLLRLDHPHSLRAIACFFGSEVMWKPWGALDYSLRTGKRAFDHVFGETIWSYFAAHPDEGNTFHQAMATWSRFEDTAVLQAYDFSDAAIVADIGGGQGSLLVGILQKHPHARGILFDAHSTIEQTKKQLPPELRARLDLVEGDFFESVPAGADVYLLKNVLHDWSDPQCLRILQNCRRAMGPTRGKVLVIEHLMPETHDPKQVETYFLNLIMMLLEQGAERSRKQLLQLYESAGFLLRDLIPLEAPGRYIAEGVPQV